MVNSENDSLKRLVKSEASPPTPSPHPERIQLFGGLTGAAMEIPEFVITPGLVVREAFAHVFGTYMVAFGKPARTNSHHPGPWVAATGGVGFDISIEVALAQGISPTGFDRLNSLWWLLVLLRLRSGLGLRMPVVSTAAFAVAPTLSEQPTMWSMEIQPTAIPLTRSHFDTITQKDLEWVAAVYVRAEKLMCDADFNRALSLFDGVRWAHDPRAAVTLTWSALEAVIRPGRTGIKKALSSALAAFLADERSERNRLFALIGEAYEHRGVITHAAANVELDPAMVTFDIARRFFCRCLDLGNIPAFDSLIASWKNGVPYCVPHPAS
ncbi:MAG: hypothetical protein ING10_04855 [Roseomonas sp.]|nr:hypothetical protein [Roseomonas sp.]